MDVFNAGQRARVAIRQVRAAAVPGAPIAEGARVALHFHPDSDADGRSVLLRVLADGRYLSQFATGTSNGGLTGAARGDRWMWEHRIFGRAYDDAAPLERPVYGALSLGHDLYGPAPRFGSAYLRLRASSLPRTTFSFPDSVFEPIDFGVPEQMGLMAVMARTELDDPLDRYIEAHVHGGVAVPEDVEALVLDPCYAGTDLEVSARSAGLPLEWHPGYVLETRVLATHASYRGAEVVVLGRALAEDGRLTPAVLGRARASRAIDPQLLKRLWHCVAALGRVPEPEIDPG